MCSSGQADEADLVVAKQRITILQLTASETNGTGSQCAVADLYRHWDCRDMVGQLVWLEYCNGWIECLQKRHAGKVRRGAVCDVKG